MGGDICHLARGQLSCRVMTNLRDKISLHTNKNGQEKKKGGKKMDKSIQVEGIPGWIHETGEGTDSTRGRVAGTPEGWGGRREAAGCMQD